MMTANKPEVKVSGRTVTVVQVTAAGEKVARKYRVPISRLSETLGRIARAEPKAEVRVSFPGVSRRQVKEVLSLLTQEILDIYGPGIDSWGWKPLVEVAGLRVRKLVLPKVRKDDDPEVIRQLVMRKVASPQPTLAVPVDGGVLLAYADQEGWLTAYEAVGVVFKGGKKPFKRAKSLLSRFPITARLAVVKVAILDDEADILDGYGLVRESWVRARIQEMRPALVGESKKDFQIKEAFKAMMAKARRSEWFSFRGVLPEGFLKCHLRVVEDGKFPDPSADIVVHRGNIKNEIASSGDSFVGMLPIGSHGAARVNVQLLAAHPWLFPESEVVEWAHDQLRKVYRGIIGGELGETIGKLMVAEQAQAEGLGEESMYLRMRWTALRLFGLGYRFENAPALGVRYAEAMSRPIARRSEDGKVLKLGVEIPCSWEGQPVSSSFASLLGFPEDRLPQGNEVRRLPGFDFAVITDAKWRALNRFGSWGSHDGDDFVVWVYRTIEGQRKVIGVRNPSDRGGYAVFDYVDGDVRPLSTRMDERGIKCGVSFPALDISSRTPSKEELGVVHVAPTAEVKHINFTSAEVEEEVTHLLKGDSPGAFANLIMALNVMGPQDSGQDRPCSMDDGIDAMVQGTNRELIAKIQGWIEAVSRGIVMEDVPFDTYMAAKCRFQVPFDLQEEGYELVVRDGLVTRIFKEIESRRKAMLVLLENWLQRHHEMPPVLREKYGVAEDDEAYRRLKGIVGKFRFACYRAMQGPTEYRKEAMAVAVAAVAAAVPKEEIGLLGYLLHRYPTSQGRISEGILYSEDLVEGYIESLGGVEGDILLYPDDGGEEVE